MRPRRGKAARAVKRSSPYGSAAWVARTAKELDLQWTLRPRGRRVSFPNLTDRPKIADRLAPPTLVFRSPWGFDDRLWPIM